MMKNLVNYLLIGKRFLKLTISVILSSSKTCLMNLAISVIKLNPVRTHTTVITMIKLPIIRELHFAIPVVKPSLVQTVVVFTMTKLAIIKELYDGNAHMAYPSRINVKQTMLKTQLKIFLVFIMKWMDSVSYTHLTLPTILLV